MRQVLVRVRRISRYRPSPALAVACLALLVALGGVSFAAAPAGLRASAAGPGDAYSKFVNGPFTPTAATDPATVPAVVSLNVPKGKYVAWGKAYATGSNIIYVRCKLEAGFDNDVGSTVSGTIATNVVHVFPAAGTVYFRCSYFGLKPASASLWAIKVTALRVASLTNTPG